MTEDRRRPCDPTLCPDHKAHELALSMGDARFRVIEEKLDVLLAWKSEMKGIWLIAAILIGIFSSLIPTWFGRLLPPAQAHADIQIERSVGK